MDCALKLVSVAFFACGSFLPTFNLARLKSMPTPGFFLRFFAGIVKRCKWMCTVLALSRHLTCHVRHLAGRPELQF